MGRDAAAGDDDAALELDVAGLEVEQIAGTAGAGAGGVAGLGDEAVDDAVELDAVVEAVLRQEDEAVDVVRGEVRPQFECDVAADGLEDGAVLLRWVDGHWRSGCGGFAHIRVR